jgi:hypothetical protein
MDLIVLEHQHNQYLIDEYLQVDQKNNYKKILNFFHVFFNSPISDAWKLNLSAFSCVIALAIKH